MLVKLLIFGGAALAAGVAYKASKAKEFDLTLSNIDWANKRFDYELTVNHDVCTG
jgi:hypothetical protein